jgi:serine/threonine protein kinase
LDQQKKNNSFIEIHVKKIGEGSYGAAYKYDDDTNIAVIKTQAKNVLYKDVSLKEALILQYINTYRFDIPLVPKFYAYHGTSTTSYIVMEYINSETLHDYIGRINLSLAFSKENSSRLRKIKAELKDIIAKIKDAIQKLHSIKIAHNDIRPTGISNRHFEQK